MTTTLVLGYDGSTCSAAALDEALALAHDLKDSEILMVYCHEPPPGLACALDPACAAARELRDYESRVEGEVELEVAAPVTVRGVLDALEARYPVLRGTMRDHATQKRRAFVRFFACGEDVSQEQPDTRLPEAVATGAEPFLVLGALAGG